MSRREIQIKTSRASAAYDITIEAGSLVSIGRWVATSTERGSRVAVVSNEKVFGLYGEAVVAELKHAGFPVSTHLIGDGERFKNLTTLGRTLESLGEAGITRTDAVIALGGGVVGDLAGFAAATYLRGIAFYQVPTTLLSMIDSSVGGKTGVNTSWGKNTVGAFYQPHAVLIDPAVLATLPKRELTAGFCEAVKHGAIGGRRMLMNVRRLLAEHPVRTLSDNLETVGDKLAELIAEQVEFKASIVRGDERESTSNTSAKSRKILNFGHTFAHALEHVTRYRRFRHGEAVGYGILFAGQLSKRLELCNNDDIELLYDVVGKVGGLPPSASIDPRDVLASFKHDKKEVSGSLQFILLRSIGKPVIINENDIPPGMVLDSIKAVIHK